MHRHTMHTEFRLMIQQALHNLPLVPILDWWSDTTLWTLGLHKSMLFQETKTQLELVLFGVVFWMAWSFLDLDF